MSRVRLTLNYPRMVLRGLLNPVLLRQFGSPQYDLRHTLVVSGYPRSGTTWLAELISLVPTTALLFEPLSPTQVPEAASAGVNWINFHLPQEQWPEGREFMERVLRGQVINKWTTSHLRCSRARGVRRWVVKFVRANQMIGWISEQFSIPPPVVVVRHPCAVFASNRSRGWGSLRRPPINRDFLAAYPHLRHIVERCSSTEEYFAASWSMDQYAHLALPHPRSYHLVSYEQLLSKGIVAVKQIFSKLCAQLRRLGTERSGGRSRMYLVVPLPLEVEAM